MSLLASTLDGPILHLQLNRPEKRNALSTELCTLLVDALEKASGDPQVAAILLTAAGPAFCAGMDLEELDTSNAGEITELHERLFTVGSRLSKPLIAAVEGGAFGGGMGVVANCHIVIASAAATFGLTEIRLGLWPFLVYRAVSAAIGERRTLELALTGRIITAAEALNLTLVHEISDSPVARAKEVAAAISVFNPEAIQAGLQSVHESIGKDWTTAGRIARHYRTQVFNSPAFATSLRAFRERRKGK